MALLFQDGFDQYGVAADIFRRWATATTNPNSFVAGRFGGQAVRGNNSSATGIQIGLAGTYTTGVIGVAFRATSFANTCLVCSFRDQSTSLGLQCGLMVTTGGKLQVYRQTTANILATAVTTTLVVNTWYYIEFKATIHNTTGAFTVNLNGVQEFTGSGLNTRGSNLSNSYFNAVSLDWGPGSNDYDDMYVIDTSGSAPWNDFLGPSQITTLLLAADTAQKDLTPDTGTANFSRVNEAVSSMTQYVGGTAVGKDLYTISPLGAIPQNIFAVKTMVLAQKQSAGPRSLRGLLKSGATLQNGITAGTNVDPQYLDDLYTLDPNTGTAWTYSSVNALQIGAEITT